jgi:hypothetical protein
VFLFLVDIGLAFKTPNEDVVWVAIFVVQLLGWLRGDSVFGFAAGDVVLSPAGWLLISVRKMKHRPEFLDQPGLIAIPPAPEGHPRAKLIGILRRASDIDPLWYCRLESADLAGVRVKSGESAPAMFLTRKLRDMVKPMAASVPAGSVIGSHSWREMAAVACYHARFDTLRMAAHGFWRDPRTMFVSYIRPYMDSFPFCRFLAGVFDFLRGV